MSSLLYDRRPIIACSSGSLSNNAISLIRISGFENLEIFSEFFSLDIKKIKPRYVYLTNLKSEDEVIDNVTFTWFKGPKSFNGENILELGVHGNLINVHIIIDLFVDQKICRLAKPGEFTLRALENKKLSLSQVEGLDLLLNANSKFSASQGIGLINGELNKTYQELREKFIKLKASVELSIDFLEDIGEEESDRQLRNNRNEFNQALESLYLRTRGQNSNMMAPTVVLLGQANAGKSTIFNLLLKQNRSIVTSTAGTTRDYISEYLYLNNINFRLVDTAGIRETKDKIEQIGISKAQSIIENAFFHVLVINPFETKLEEIKSWNQKKFDLILWTHFDMPRFKEKYDALKKELGFSSEHELLIGAENGSGPIEPEVAFGPIEPLNTKNKTGPIGPLKSKENSGPIGPLKSKENSGPIGPLNPKQNTGPIGPLNPKQNTGPIGPLNPKQNTGPIGPSTLDLEKITNAISSKYLNLCKDQPILVDRHRQVIGVIYNKNNELGNLLESEQDIAITSSLINSLGEHIFELIGVVSPQEILEDIFSNFCIGK